MGVLNPKRVVREAEASHQNWMNGKSWDISSPIIRLWVAASSSFFGEPMYYHREEKPKSKSKSGSIPAPALTDQDLKYLRTTLDAIDPQEWRSMTPKQMIESAIDAALDFDPVETLKLAVRLRNEADIRTTPQVIMVRAANHPKVRGTNLIGEYAPKIMLRVDEPCVQLAYQIEAFGRYSKSATSSKPRKAGRKVGNPIPNSLKRAWKAFLEGMPRDKLAKYRMESREVKLVDVVKLCHAHSEALDDLIHGKLKLEDDTWESIISSEGSNKDAWTKSVEVMGHMALLRNLRNFHEKGVDSTIYLPKLVATAKYGRQLPFRYFSAYRELEKVGAPGNVLDGIEAALVVSMDNMPRFPGRVMSLSDNSGSAWGATTSSLGKMEVANIGNLTAVLTGMLSDEGYVGVFGDKLEVIPIRTRSSIFDQLQKVSTVGQGVGKNTENGIWLFWDKAIRTKEHWDTVFVYSDMQAGNGGLYGTDFNAYREYAWPQDPRKIDVAKLIQTYRKKVNPNVNVFLVQVAGYQDTLVPSWFKRTYILGGWGDGVLKFAAEMQNMLKDQVQGQ